ncbi:MAG: DUF2252 domain-containing protein [Anaerolineales bacterium]
MSTSERSTQTLQAITEWDAWLTPENRKAKYSKMAVSPFGFYRGTNHLFWRDFAGDVRLARFGGVRTWLQGDLHAENFGAFTNDQGQVVYSVNDFDEAVFADYQYDLWRMAISLCLVMEKISEKAQKKIIGAFAGAYLESLERYCQNDKEKKSEFSKKNTKGKLQKFLEEAEKKNSRAKLLNEWTTGAGHFDPTNDRLSPLPDSRREEILAALPGYLLTLSGAGKSFGVDHLHVKDMALRLNAGTGSLGTPRYYLLVEGKSHLAGDDVILDVKRQTKPSAYPFLSAQARAEYDRLFDQDAQRAVIAYRAMTHNADDYLGWLRLADGSYLVRERTFVKEAFPLEKLKGEKDFERMAGQWGKILATLHARADHLPGISHEKSFEQQVTERTEKRSTEFLRLVSEVALEYAAQVRVDWARFVRS